MQESRLRLRPGPAGSATSKVAPLHSLRKTSLVFRRSASTVLVPTPSTRRAVRRRHAADQTPLLADHRKHDPVVEDDELFALQAKLGEGAERVVQEGTDCRPPLANLHPPVKDRIGSEEAQYRVDVTLIHSLEGKARQLNRADSSNMTR